MLAWWAKTEIKLICEFYFILFICEFYFSKRIDDLGNKLIQFY